MSGQLRNETDGDARSNSKRAWEDSPLRVSKKRKIDLHRQLAALEEQTGLGLAPQRAGVWRCIREWSSGRGNNFLSVARQRAREEGHRLHYCIGGGGSGKSTIIAGDLALSARVTKGLSMLITYSNEAWKAVVRILQKAGLDLTGKVLIFVRDLSKAERAAWETEFGDVFYHPDKGSLLEQIGDVRILICTLAQSEKQFVVNLGHLARVVGSIVSIYVDEAGQLSSSMTSPLVLLGVPEVTQIYFFGDTAQLYPHVCCDIPWVREFLHRTPFDALRVVGNEAFLNTAPIWSTTIHRFWLGVNRGLAEIWYRGNLLPMVTEETMLNHRDGATFLSGFALPHCEESLAPLLFVAKQRRPLLSSEVSQELTQFLGQALQDLCLPAAVQHKLTWLREAWDRRQVDFDLGEFLFMRTVYC